MPNLPLEDFKLGHYRILLNASAQIPSNKAIAFITAPGFRFSYERIDAARWAEALLGTARIT